jgi:redox-sensitive bicupin YhaK (pirin superfamily)
MIEIRRANERGRTRTSWLDSRHTFSFGDYHDPKHVHFGALRVINEDVVEPGAGFGVHPHRDMEILTYVLAGELEHKDSLGNGSTIPAGSIQRMTAGTGVTHSEWNHSAHEPVHFLQIWIFPQTKGLLPGYEEAGCSDSNAGNWQILSSNLPGAGVFVNQDVVLRHANLLEGSQLDLKVEPGRLAWLHVIEGDLKLDRFALNAGDGAAIDEPQNLKVSASDSARILWFDLLRSSED